MHLHSGLIMVLIGSRTYWHVTVMQASLRDAIGRKLALLDRHKEPSDLPNMVYF